MTPGIEAREHTIEDTNLDQVTLVMKMEKESDDKSAESAENSADFSHYGGWY